MTFRWYGEKDPVTLEKIRQIPTMTGIVSAVYDVKPGELWSEQSIDGIKTAANSNGLSFEVVESVPVHEEIKLGGANSDKLIDNYCENIRRLSKAGVKVICYNFMPVFDWLRSDLAREQADGANALAFDEAALESMNPASGGLSLPGWDESYTKEEMQTLLHRYESVDREQLFRNFKRFLHYVIPVAESSGIRMAIHPDDPPWDIFGLPRIITGGESYERMLSINKSPYNGITLCTGSLGAGEKNDVAALAAKYAEHIPFVHLRNVLVSKNESGGRCFEETAHPSGCGSLDMLGIVKSLCQNGFDGYVRPDHGRMIWGEQGRPGYGLYDRALGATYIAGLFEACEKLL